MVEPRRRTHLVIVAAFTLALLARVVYSAGESPPTVMGGCRRGDALPPTTTTGRGMGMAVCGWGHAPLYVELPSEEWTHGMGGD